MINNFKNNNGFMANLKTKGPYKAEDGFIFGVAKGIAQHYNWSVFMVRLVIVLLACLLAFWPIIILYLILAVVMSPKPKHALNNSHEEAIWLGSQMANNLSVQNLQKRRQELLKRLERLESHVTSKAYKWDEALKKMK